MLENPIGTTEANYLTNGNRLLLDLFNVEVVMCDALHDPMAQLAEQAERLEAQGFRPYVVPVGGSNALGALGYVKCALEIAEQSSASFVDFSAVVVASGSAGTHAGLAVALQHLMPDTQLIGVTVSRSADAQRPKVEAIARDVTTQLQLGEKTPSIILWDDYFAPRYGEPNEGGTAAVKLLAEQEAMLLIRCIPAKRWPVYLRVLSADYSRKKARFCSFTPAAHRHCLRIIRRFNTLQSAYAFLS